MESMRYEWASAAGSGSVYSSDMFKDIEKNIPPKVGTKDGEKVVGKKRIRDWDIEKGKK